MARYTAKLDTGDVNFKGNVRISFRKVGEARWRSSGIGLAPKGGVFTYSVSDTSEVRFVITGAKLPRKHYPPVDFTPDDDGVARPLPEPIPDVDPEEAAHTSSGGGVGTQGPKGDKGDKGDTGNTGPKGDKGDKGDPGTGGGVALHGTVVANVQSSTGVWSLSKANADAAHAAGAVILWVTNSTVNFPPTVTDGIADGDIIDGVAVGEGESNVPPAEPPELTVVLSDRPTATQQEDIAGIAPGRLLDAFAGGATGARWLMSKVGTGTCSRGRIAAGQNGLSFEAYSGGSLSVDPTTYTLPTGEVEVQFDLDTPQANHGGWVDFAYDGTNTVLTRIGHQAATDGKLTFRYRSDADGIATTTTLVTGVEPVPNGTTVYRIGPSGLSVKYNGVEVAKIDQAFLPTNQFRISTWSSAGILFKKVIVRKEVA